MIIIRQSEEDRKKQEAAREEAWRMFQAELKGNSFKGWWCSHLRWWPPGSGQRDMAFSSHGIVERTSFDAHDWRRGLDISFSKAYITYPFIDEHKREKMEADEEKMKLGGFRLDGVPTNIDEISFENGHFKIIGDKDHGYHYKKECELSPPGSFKEEELEART